MKQTIREIVEQHQKDLLTHMQAQDTLIKVLEQRENPTPEPKVIDMSCLVGSDVLCEFSNTNVDWIIGSLINEEDSGNYVNGTGAKWDYCRPLMSPYIHACPKGYDKSPVPEGYRVKVCLRGGGEISGSAAVFKWSHRDQTIGGSGEIIAFEVIGLLDGWAER